MKLHRTKTFLRAYHLLPHALLNRAALALSRADGPRFLVDATIRRWIRRGNIDMTQFEDASYRTVEDFFLRRLRPGARPLGPGIVSPADGAIVEAGILDPARPMRVKGRPTSVECLVNGAHHALPLASFAGGAFAAIFLSPDGYHRLHAPADGTIDLVQWIPGRFFPQNDDALQHIDRVWERNERAVLRLCPDDGTGAMLLVLVGASLVGGIELRDLPRARWALRDPIAPALRVERGEEIAHFRFGSTIVILAEPAVARATHLRPGDAIRMGETLFA